MARTIALAASGLIALTVVSSWLGLTGTWWFRADGPGAGAFFWAIWAASALADVVFIAGTMAAGTLAWRIAERDDRLLSAAAAVLAGGFAHWIVYAASFMLLPEAVKSDTIFGLLDSLQFVLTWGWVGLLFAALAPPVAQRIFANVADADRGLPTSKP